MMKINQGADISELEQTDDSSRRMADALIDRLGSVFTGHGDRMLPEDAKRVWVDFHCVMAGMSEYNPLILARKYENSLKAGVLLVDQLPCYSCSEPVDINAFKEKLAAAKDYESLAAIRCTWAEIRWLASPEGQRFAKEAGERRVSREQGMDRQAIE